MSDIINFDDIDQFGPQEYRGTYQIDPSDFDREEVTGLGPATIELRVEATGVPGEYDADGTATFAADLECSRCVEPYPFANASSFHVRFRPRPEPERENEEVEITGDEELDVEFYSERTIPLRDLAAEQIQLAIPMKPLCDEECLGLCPKCGANRSRESCSCDQSLADPRWDALQGIRDQLSKKS